ncbi:hypothetical protein KIP88_02915 [Bradyrhizobium sp. SRL28]|uniref:DUF7178 family protein n=1 Tax=Bradyrhizobium sp. SRL28 TaxID=2836178 RepID=UPI001BDE3E5E|nr:hypothetical protein [Bradyrhizobium sp. SRL28]MBT1509443.1 hypothetical protein [Bradyrhizobium sp. SRL28]
MLRVLAQAEAQLTLAQRFRIARARARRLLAKKQPFDESEHPRDEHGRWTTGGGGGDIDTDKVEAKTKANVATASALAKASGVTPLPGSKGEHPNTIASRNPTAKGTKKNPAPPPAYGQPDVASMKLEPERYEHDIGLFKNDDFYPNFRAEDLSGSTDEAVSNIVDQMKDNLKFLYQYADKSTQVWYDGARALVDDRVKLYGFNDASVAAVYAALSPTKDWDQNVHIADMLLQTYKKQQGTVWSKEMDEKSKTLWSAKNQKVVDLVRGKTLGELTSPAEKALWIRTYDETHNNPAYRTVLPNGALGEVTRNKDGSPAKVVWQSLPAITNAVRALEANGDLKIISDAMGTAHKVRSFYNNILDPHSANGDVTIDTHAVGAALLRQLSGSTVAVSHNFGNTPMKVDQPEGWEAAGASVKTGLSGLYPVYAQAYREAAKELGIQPRQLQSAVWVVKRDTFGNASKKTQDAIEAAWHAYHDNPKVTLEQTRSAIAKLIGLDKHERHYRIDEQGGRAGDARELHRDGVGPAAADMDGGAGDGAAGRAAGLDAVRTEERRAGAEELDWPTIRAQAQALLERKPKKPKQTEIELWPEKDETRDAFMDRCVIALTKCVGAKKAPGVCARKWRKSEKLGKKELVTRAAIEAEADADLLIEPCGKVCLACEGAPAPWSSKEWDEGKHPRVPAGGPDGGQFGPGGGGGAGSSAKPKGKGKAKKEDFDKAKIAIEGDKARQDAVIEKWNQTIGEDPAVFKQKFMGGLNGDMKIQAYGITGKFSLSGNVQNDQGSNVGTYTRDINIDDKSAYSAYFQLNRGSRGADMGKQMLAGNVETYRELGIEKVGVTANIDVGGYAWAKYGYVPTQESWNELRASLERRVSGGSSSARPGFDTYEADDWNMLSSDRQADVRDAWMRSTYSEFLESEEQNWRESGQALEDSKNSLVDLYNEGSIPEWATEAFAAARETREDAGDTPIPYTDQQLFAAISLDYKSKYGDGRDDPEVTFDDDKLQEPAGYDPTQQTLPGIEPLDPSQFLSQEMRDQLEKEMIDGFNEKAEKEADEIDPPTYLADSIAEYQEEYWDQKDDAEKLRHAVDLGLADIEIEPDEDDEEEPQLELDDAEEDPLLDAIHDRDPKAIWKVADSPRGKDLLLGTNWSGVLNLKDAEAMKRFDDYVGRVKHG